MILPGRQWRSSRNRAANQSVSLLSHQLLVNLQHRFAFGGVHQHGVHPGLQFDVVGKPAPPAPTTPAARTRSRISAASMLDSGTIASLIAGSPAVARWPRHRPDAGWCAGWRRPARPAPWREFAIRKGILFLQRALEGGMAHCCFSVSTAVSSARKPPVRQLRAGRSGRPRRAHSA